MTKPNATTTLERHVRPTLRAIWQSFWKQESGVVIVLATLAMPVMLTLTAVTIDYTNAERLRAAAQASLDAALLAAAGEYNNGSLEADEINAYVNEYYEATMLGKGLEAISIGTVNTVVDDEAGTVSGSLRATSQAIFSGIINPDGVDVGVEADIFLRRQQIEVAMVLDVTGSMNGARLEALKDAATDMVSSLIPPDGTTSIDSNVRVSIVPYSDLVNVGPYEVDVTGYNSGESCVYERTGGRAFRDVRPFGPHPAGQADDDGIVNLPPNGNGDRDEKPDNAISRRNFNGYVCNNPELLPLSANRAELVDRIESFTASGWTSGHIGIQWGWYTLSRRFSSVWPGVSRPAAYNEDDVLKVMVLMTDGAFNTWYESGNGSSFSQGDRLCAAIKDAGIEIYTVGFLTGTVEDNFLRGCSSGPDYHFEASSQEALVGVFRTIGQTLSELRIAN